MTDGTLYAVGVGPGDPELLTVKAARLITSADVVAYYSGTKGTSIARSIVADLIPEGVLGFEYRASSEDIGITVHAHPTLSEAVKEAALAVTGRAIHF